MEMTKRMSTVPIAMSALVAVAIFLTLFAITPIASAASLGSDYPIEIIRAHTVYKVADPVAPVQVGLGVYGNR